MLPAIRLEGVSKRYWISSLPGRERFLDGLRRVATGASSRRPLWALRELSVEVGHGQILGVIGPNGAGKSTLLLLMAGILGPTEGRVRIEGRVRLFFQLASGLQPRLTVFENLRLCAALLGIPGRRFAKLLPAMVEFAGLEEYVHARYGELSTGLAARVPFAVAVHSEMDVVLVDEMLAVGDEAFQRKCFETFRRFQREGKTMVVATHSLDQLGELAPSTLYLRAGREAFLGPTVEAVARMRSDLAL